MTALIERPLQGYDDELESIRAVLADIIRHFGNVGIIERSIHLVQYKERRWLEANMECEYRVS